MPNPNLRSPRELMVHRGEQTPTLGPVERFGMLLLRWLKTGNPAATMDRLFVSKHVDDLRFIVAVAAVLLSISIVLCLVYACETAPTPGPGFLWNVVKVLAVFFGQLATVSAVFGAIGAWAYKAGSTRLGVVDLFACEISTLCRVTLVTDTVGRLKARIERAGNANSGCSAPAAESKPEVSRPGKHTNDDRTPPSLVMQFTSAENYFPVFEGNTRDLQSLEARVVINITSFYMKTVRDLMRTAATRKPEPVTPEIEKADQLYADTWRNAMRDVIYMLFLGLEAGRDSVQDLVEFVPEQAERTIVILLSELKAYLFLLQEFTDVEEMHARRLLLRWDRYQKLFPELTLLVKNGLKNATTELAKAKAARRPKAEISRRELELDVWQGAEKLSPDLELLYQKLGAINPKPPAA
jgi:hypothetical protein